MVNLRKVYRKGQGAYIGAGIKKCSVWQPGLWVRVNSYMTGKGGARKADIDIHKIDSKYPKEKIK